MNKKICLRFLSLLVIISLLINIPVISHAKSKVKLNKTSVTLTIGGTVTLKVKNTTKKVKWSSSKRTVATVDSDGEVYANKAGKTKITAKVGKKKYICKVEVLRQYISNDTMMLNIGESQDLKILGISKNDTITWGSDDENIAIVSENGEVTALKSGETSIYAMLNSGTGETYECKVIVIGNNISVTPTPEPVVTPTPEPVLFPNDTSKPQETARPTETPNIIPDTSTNKSNYGLFSEFLMSYGVKNDNGYGLSDSIIGNNAETKYGIIYDNINNVYKFLMVTNDYQTSSQYSVEMELSENSLNNAKTVFTFIGKKDACQGTAYIDVTKYVANRNLTFTYDWQGNDIMKIFEESYNKLGSGIYALAVSDWNYFIGKFNLGFDIRGLGFYSY